MKMAFRDDHRIRLFFRNNCPHLFLDAFAFVMIAFIAQAVFDIAQGYIPDAIDLPDFLFQLRGAVGAVDAGDLKAVYRLFFLLFFMVMVTVMRMGLASAGRRIMIFLVIMMVMGVSFRDDRRIRLFPRNNCPHLFFDALAFVMIAFIAQAVSDKAQRYIPDAIDCLNLLFQLGSAVGAVDAGDLIFIFRRFRHN